MWQAVPKSSFQHPKIVQAFHSYWKFQLSLFEIDRNATAQDNAPCARVRIPIPWHRKSIEDTNAAIIKENQITLSDYRDEDFASFLIAVHFANN